MLQIGLENPIVVSPDIGGVVRARAIAKLLNDTDMAIIDKRRPRANVSQVMHIIGDVSGRDCVLVDDMIDTGGTLCKAAEALKERGAKRVSLLTQLTRFSLAMRFTTCVTPLSTKLSYVTPSHCLMKSKHCQTSAPTLSGMLAEAIRRISNEESISAMFEH